MKEIKVNKIKESIFYDKCDNGLEIYMYVNEKVNNYYATLNVKYGSIDTKFKVGNKEYKVSNGIAHFLEHITFNESDGSSASDFFDERGTSTNAFTTFEYTAYEIYGSNNILENTKHLIDFVFDKNITEEIVKNEKNIIVEEVKMDKNDVNHKLYFNILKSIYKNNNKRNEITGLENDVKNISKKELDLVYDNFYHPSNMFMVICGNFNPYEMALMIKEDQSKRKIKEVKTKKIYEKEEKEVNIKYQLLKENVEIPKVSIAYKMSRKKFKDYNDFLLKNYLNIILNANFGPTSMLRDELLEKKLIISLNYDTLIDKDNVVISLSIETKYPNEITNIIKENMKKISMTSDILDRKIKCNIAELIIGFENIEYVNLLIQNDIIFYNKFYNNRYDIYKSLNIEDLRKIIKHIDLNNESIIIVEPNKD